MIMIPVGHRAGFFSPCRLRLFHFTRYSHSIVYFVLQRKRYQRQHTKLEFRAWSNAKVSVPYWNASVLLQFKSGSIGVDAICQMTPKLSTTGYEYIMEFPFTSPASCTEPHKLRALDLGLSRSARIPEAGTVHSYTDINDHRYCLNWMQFDQKVSAVSFWAVKEAVVSYPV